MSSATTDSIRFTVNNEIIRDAQFNQTLTKAKTEGTQINSVEIVSVSGETDAAATARANDLLRVLKEEGAATNDATVVVRKADIAERDEIIRSGFALNDGIVLKK